MKEWRQKSLIFLTALGTTLAGIFPAAGCTGGCANCFQCAGIGGVAAILAALGLAGWKKPGGDIRDAVKPIVNQSPGA